VSYRTRHCVNHPMGTLRLHNNRPLYNNTVTGTLAVDGSADTFCTARMGLGGLRPRQSPPRCTKCNSAHINGQCTNFKNFSNSVKCPCNVTHDSVTIIFTFLIIGPNNNNNNNNNNNKGKEKWIDLAPFYEHLTFNALRYGSHSFTCKQHHTACLYHIQLLLTIHLSIPKG